MRWGWVAAGLGVAVAGVGVAVLVATARDGGGRECASFPDAFEAGITRQVCGPVLDRYRVEGGPGGRLGLPVTGERAVTLGPARPFADREFGFRGGTIYLDSRTGNTVIGAWFPYVPLR